MSQCPCCQLGQSPGRGRKGVRRKGWDAECVWLSHLLTYLWTAVFFLPAGLGSVLR